VEVHFIADSLTDGYPPRRHCPKAVMIQLAAHPPEALKPGMREENQIH